MNSTKHIGVNKSSVTKNYHVLIYVLNIFNNFYAFVNIHPSESKLVIKITVFMLKVSRAYL
jgi:hypothetical protein